MQSTTNNQNNGNGIGGVDSSPAQITNKINGGNNGFRANSMMDSINFIKNKSTFVDNNVNVTACSRKKK